MAGVLAPLVLDVQPIGHPLEDKGALAGLQRLRTAATATSATAALAAATASAPGAATAAASRRAGATPSAPLRRCDFHHTLCRVSGSGVEGPLNRNERELRLG